MPYSITVKNLSWSTPDGHRLFSDLNLSFGPGKTGLIGRNGAGKSTLLNIIAGRLKPSGGTVRCDGRVAMMRQLAQIPAGRTLADVFGVTDALACLRRIESGHPAADDLARADWTLETRLDAAFTEAGLTGIGPDEPLANLSGGEKTRALLAALLFRGTDIILLDEPTNDLDAEGRAAVAQLLSRWRGTAVIASHDRVLLDGMDMIVELTGIGARTYGGNWSAYRARKAVELQAAEHRSDVAERKVRDIDAQARLRLERQQKRDSIGRRKRARGDQPKLLLDSMKQRAQKTGGAGARLAGRQRDTAARQAAEARAEIEILQPLSMALGATGLPDGRTVVEVTGLTGGHDPQAPLIRDLSLRLVGPERVAVTGPNGSGKTTLLKLLAGDMRPQSGIVRRNGRFAVLDQHMSLLDPALTIRDNFRNLNPDADENSCRAALARFLFRADAAMQKVGTLSGGEMLRAGLAVVLGGPGPPDLLMLDEPTNHLDLQAIQALEAALQAYDGALLVVSHDPVFLENIGIERTIELDPPDAGAV